ncbi:hypothetical protein CN925_04280 [Bacillus sp. AFS055030]|nr:hypothetical protein CN925_04280 [Bacillus sp. AFS055030]
MQKPVLIVVTSILIVLLFLIINIFDVLNYPSLIRQIGFVFFTMLWIYGIYQNRKSLLKIGAMIFCYFLLMVWGNIL